MANLLEFSFGGLSNSTHESKIPRDRCYAMQNCFVDNGILEISPRYSLFGERSGAASGDIGWGLGYGSYSGNETQSISLASTVSGGAFVLKWRPSDGDSYNYSSSIDYNGTAEEVQNALEAMGHISPGDVRVKGGPLPNSRIKVEFIGQYANTNVPMLELHTSTLAGAATGVTIAEQAKGSLSQQYMVVVQHSGSGTANLYKVDPDTGVYTELDTGLNASNCFFQQFGSKVYAVNNIDGLRSYVIGAESAENTQKLEYDPLNQITLDYLWESPAWSETFGVAGSFTYSGFTSSPATQYSYQTGVTQAKMSVQLNATQTQPASTLSITYTISSSGNYCDLQYNDAIAVSVTVGASGTGEVASTSIMADTFKIVLVADDGTLIYPKIRTTVFDSNSGGWGQSFARRFLFAENGRDDRRSVKGFKLEFEANKLIDLEVLSISLDGWGWNYMGDDDGSVDLITGPTSAKFDYAYSLYEPSTDAESSLSEIKQSNEWPNTASFFAGYITLSVPTDSRLTSSDKIYFYRRSKVTNRFMRLPNPDGSYGVANTGGTVTFDDHFMEHELEGFPPYQFLSFPDQGGETTEQIGVWKQCLCIGSSKQVFISRVGQPESFVESPDVAADLGFVQIDEEDDLARGKTDYVSDTRAENVYGIHGQDSLYLVTPESTYAIIGDLPAESTPPRRLPESRGTLGYRSSYRIGGGVLSAAQDGLWFMSVGRGFSGDDNGALVAREETEQIRESYSDTFMAGLRTASGAVVCEFDNELWLFNGTRYLFNSRNRSWHEGTFSDSVKAVWPSRTLGFRFLDSKGALYTIAKDYSTDDGTEVEWSYTTGLIDGARSRIRAIHIRGEGRPKVKVEVYDGLTPMTTRTFQQNYDSANYVIPVTLPPGFRYRFTISGKSDETLEYFALEIEEAPSGKGN